MKKILPLALTTLLTLCAAFPAPRTGAQTVQGDILRGKGRYLEGAGWYNLNTARAGRINVETWKATNREAQRLYRDYMADRSRHIQARKGLTNKVQAELLRKMEEDQRRWREDPTPDDIASGDALNALAGDLADPSLHPSAWSGARVDLPPSLTLTALAFKVVDSKKSRLQQSTVAIDRMLVKDNWPLPFRRPEIERECDAYEKAVAGVVDKCRKGVELQAADYDRLRGTVVALQKGVETAVPPRDNQRAQARDFAKRLDEATRIFAEQAYAEQLIRDVSEYKATTVAELLAFMRDYRLLFSDPGSSPEVASLYEGLYGLLRRQKEALGIRSGSPSDVFSAGSVWVNVDPNRPINLKVVERNPRDFRALLTIGKDQRVVREVRGEIGNDTVSWRGADSRTVGGPQAKTKAQMKAQMKAQAKAARKAQAKEQGVNIRGTVKGNEIHFTSIGGGGPGDFVLRKGP